MVIPHKVNSYYFCFFFTKKADSFSDEQKLSLRTGFDLFDKDGNGYITANELGDVIRSSGYEPTEDLIKTMVRFYIT